MEGNEEPKGTDDVAGHDSLLQHPKSEFTADLRNNELVKSASELKLSDEELSQLEYVLMRAPHVDYSSLEGLEGFLVAIAISTRTIDFGWVQDSMCDEMKDGSNFHFNDSAEDVAFRVLVIRHFQYIFHLIDEMGSQYKPTLQFTERRGEKWARGFSRAVDDNDWFWDVLSRVEPNDPESMFVIMELASGEVIDIDKPINEPDEPLSDEVREKHVEKIGEIIGIYLDFADRAYLQFVDELQERIDEEAEQEKRQEDKSTGKRKVGRNDPCPCGSGKKYKKCCGL